ncbi:phenylalanyl-tRNA synthetase [Stachybotrys elegans]|uniref:Phenylalanine--tRNA ligase, mitochondrial n=1 Tax=Stachybotrys elegans TaxID=80388 RepID=A0A8K0SQ14_9HYPO|nr:phenylalanyl-tRNA synthetase [Stachybotrys elegans]
MSIPMQVLRRCVVPVAGRGPPLLRASRALQWRCAARRAYSSENTPPGNPPVVSVLGKNFNTTKDWFNVPVNVLKATSRQLHLQNDHPVAITRQIIQANFPAPTYQCYNDFHPVVSTQQNFDSLGFPPNHPGRAKSDTYYINGSNLLRTHTSAHQADVFRQNSSDGFLIAADVYRRDAIDRSHYPVFHQMEGARTWDRTVMPGGDVAAAVRLDTEKLGTHDVVVEDPNPPYHPERNPIQEGHTEAEVTAIGQHLKRSLELMVIDIFKRAKMAAAQVDPDFVDEPLRMRWVEAEFPFTSPSWELEVYYEGNWLEVLGCGVVKQDILNNAGASTRVGWAFGIGIERIAMLLFKVTDIRLFWSQDERFLTQFEGVSANLDKLRLFKPFSKYPAARRDVSFWLPSSSSSPSAAGGNTGRSFHENDAMEVVRRVAGDAVEDVSVFDDFTHPKTGRRSIAYRIVYRLHERTLTAEEIKDMHDKVMAALVEDLGVEIR